MVTLVKNILRHVQGVFNTFQVQNRKHVYTFFYLKEHNIIFSDILPVCLQVLNIY